MNNDIYIEIIRYCNINTLINLRKVNRFFRYHSTKIFKIKILKKHLKNIRTNLLLTRKFPLEPIDIVINDNFSDNFEELKNINISKINALCVLLTNKIFPLSYNTFYCSFNRYPILQSFTIRGKNITKVYLTVDNKVVYKCHYLNAGLVNIKPFFNGLNVLLCMLPIRIIVCADFCDNIYTYHKLLNSSLVNEIFELMDTEIVFPYTFYNENQLYSSMSYLNGDIILNI